MHDEPVTHDMGLITTAGVVIGVKYSGGVVLASDRIVSYGSSFKFSDVSHFAEITPTCILGCTGEMSDFQDLTKMLNMDVRRSQCSTGGASPAPSEIFCLTKRIMYGRRSRMNPLLMTAVIAGRNDDGSSFLGVSDSRGTSWEDDIVTTGLAASMKGLQLEGAVKGTREDVLEAIKNVAIAFNARNAQSVGKWEVVDISESGIKFLDPIAAEPRWAGFTMGSEWTKVEVQ